MERRLQESVDEKFRKDVSDAHNESRRSSPRPSKKNIDQFLANREELFRIAEHHHPGVRQNQVPPGASNQLFSQSIFQLVDLGAEGWLCHAKLRARAGQTSFTGDDPEVTQVVIVEPFHLRTILRF